MRSEFFVIYLNGKFLNSDQAKIPVADRGLLLGDGVFETMRASHGNIKALEAHWQRLTTSLAFLNIPFLMKYVEFEAMIHQLLIKNDLCNQETAIRVTVTRGEGVRGLLPTGKESPNFFATAFPYSISINPNFKLHISSILRNEFSPITKIKSINYLDNILARLEASKQGADDALLLNTKGFLTESTVSNVFIVINGEVLTPSVHDGLLPGITRSIILDICSQLHLPHKEASITPEMLFQAEEVFLTNSLQGIQAVKQINKQLFLNTNPLTRRISDFYNIEAQ